VLRQKHQLQNRNNQRNNIKKNIQFLYCILVSLLLCGCAKRQEVCPHKVLEQHIIEQVNSHKEAIIDVIVQQEAMITNIPFPLYDERIIPAAYTVDTCESVVFGYKSPFSSSQAIEFFLIQMERFGWKYLVFFDGFESILQFKNPTHYCTIIIKEYDSNHSLIMIYRSERTGKFAPDSELG